LTGRVVCGSITLCDRIIMHKINKRGEFCLLNSDIIRGHLDSIILRLIIEKDRYGYEISKEISMRTNDRFNIKEATLYAVFQRLEKKDLIRAYYGDFTHGGKRKYYSITTLGKAYYREKVTEWNAIKNVINLFMEGLE